jgi:hypothetical protein
VPPPDDAETTRQAIYVTSFMLLLLGGSFMRGMREVIGIAVVIVAIYLVLSTVVVGAGLVYRSSTQPSSQHGSSACRRGPGI